MSRSLPLPVHPFHIPVMGTGFTIQTPLRVARYGISSVISIIDDMLVEQTRHRVAKNFSREAEPIGLKEDDSRARRITAYLNLVDEIVEEQVSALRSSAFEAGSEITRYFEMLPLSPLRDLYDRMRHLADGPDKIAAQEELRAQVRPGALDVNIMTKLDRDPATGAIASGTYGSHAMAALRGFARSTLNSSVVMSAGLNLRLFSYLAEFEDFFPDAAGKLRKGIILKVGDLRSAAIQGKVLAKRGLWVSEFRIESGLNCGGHAFGERGQVLGPILEEFKHGREALLDGLYQLTNKALGATGRHVFPERPLARVTVQGGIGTSEENRMLHEIYGVDGTGWGSPFLLCPEVVSIDPMHVEKLLVAGEDDVELSRSSPLGVPFWNLKTSASEIERRERIEEGKPGSPCPKGFLIFDTQYNDKGMCTASRGFQKRKLVEIEAATLSSVEREDQREAVLAKQCLCRNLAGGAEEADEQGVWVPTAVCCGPNVVYFNAVTTLREMVDHIYGRIHLPLSPDRPHMFLKELSLHVNRLREQAQRQHQGLVSATNESMTEARETLLAAVDHYKVMAARITGDRASDFVHRLERVREDLEALTQSNQVAVPGKA